MASLTAKRNLLPFFEHWRFTIIEETREKMLALNLEPLEKEIWKDLLATEEEENNGTYRISDSVGRLPTGELKEELLSIPFE